MQKLEKILEEMKKIKDENMAEKLYAKYLPDSDEQKILNAYSQGYEDGTDNFYNVMVEIIRKHMNDGWIPTKERMPTKEECERDNIRFLISVGTDCWYSTEIAKCSWVEADNADGTDGSYSEFWIDQFPHIYRPSHRLIAAWKILELPEPYIPRWEESEEE